jgi:hypothetical protein
MCVHVVWQAVGCADRVDSITHQGCGTVRALLCRHVVVLVWHCASVLRIHTICLASFCSHLQMLHDTFSAFGVIINTPKIMRDPDTGMQTTTVWVCGGDLCWVQHIYSEHGKPAQSNVQPGHCV